MKNNLHYFEISKRSPEPHLDKDYFLLEKNSELPLFLKNIKEIKELLITIKRLKSTKESKVVVEKYYATLFDVFKKRFSNCSEFGCFVNACDTTRDLVQKDFKIFKIITDFYLAKRDIDDKTPANWVQAILDGNSSRKKGFLGEKKLIKLLNISGFSEVSNWEDFKNRKKVFASFSKKNFNSLKKIRENLDIDINSKKQNKKLDLLIKRSDRIFLLEAKHLNVGGGEQNKQVSELIEILSLKEKNPNIFYIAFLDGTHSNVILGDVSSRAIMIKQQQREIIQYIKRNPKSFWMNTAGFKSLLKDIN